MFKQIINIFNVIGLKNRLNSLKLLIILSLIVLFEILSIGLIIPSVSLIIEEENFKYFEHLKYLSAYFSINTITLLLIILILIFSFKLFFLFFFEYKTQHYLKIISIDLFYKIYSFYILAPWKKIIKKDHAYVVRNITSDTEIFVKQGLLNLVLLFKNVIIVFVFTMYLFSVNVKFTIFVLGFFIFFLLLFIFFLKNRLIDISFKRKDAVMFRFRNITETIFSLREIKLINNENYFINLFKQNEEKIADLNIQLALISKMPRLVLELLIVFAVAVSIIFLTKSKIEIYDLLPVMALYIYITFRLIPTFISINHNLQAIKYSKAQIDEVITNIKITNKLGKKETINQNTTYKVNDVFDVNSLEGKNISFRYSDESPVIFENANFRFEKGSIISIEGENGTGKSTLLDIISGLMRPNEGQLLVNDEEILENLTAYQNKIGYVSQSIFLHNVSIKENLLFGRKNISNEDLENTLQLTNIKQFTDNLPRKLETQVGSIGKFLSGGQKQKIGIARALLGKPKVIILDEATSALDKESQKNFFEVISKIKKDKIILVISHNDDVRSFCDIRYVVRDKKIKLI